MIMRINSMWTFALFPALAVSAVPLSARAAEPAKGEAKKLGPAMTRAQFMEKNKIAYKRMQDEKAELLKQPPPIAYLESRTVSIAPHEIEVRVEKFRDASILYSTPVEKEHEDVIYKMAE